MRVHKSNVFTVLLLLAFLVSACAPSATPTPAPTGTQAPAPTQAPTQAPSATPEPAASSADLAALQANAWQWVSFTNPVEQFEVEEPASYTLTFNQDGTLNIVADCNNAAASYMADGSSLAIEVGPMTLAACPPESRSDTFVEYLGFAAVYFFEDDNLYIDLFADGGTLEFAPADADVGAAAVDLTANAWQWTAFTSPVEQYEVENSENYRVIFGENDMLFVFADCNTVQGNYTQNGQSIKIELGASTLAACPEESRSDQLLSYLPNAAIYSFQDGNLLIDLFADGGTLTFSPFDPLAALRVASWQELLEKQIQSCDAPGGVLLADTPQGRFLSASGLASTQEQIPMQPTDPFQIGSNTKSFTTVLSLLLQEEGVWSLDDPLSQWLPEQAAKITNGDQISLRMLGQNHTGIPDYADWIIGDALKGESLDQASLEKGYTPEEIVDYVVQNFEPSFAPGEGWEYSTTNFILLAMAAEAATGQTLDQLYQERIFAPLGMEDTFLLNDVPEAGAFVNGYYTLQNGTVVDVTNWNGSQGWAGGSIVSTAEDMAKYAAGLASGSVFADPASLEQLTAFGDGMVGPFSSYGLGVGTWSTDPFAWGHAGQTPGFQSLFAIYPEQDTRVIYFVNSGSCNVYNLTPFINASPDLFTQELP